MDDCCQDRVQDVLFHAKQGTMSSRASFAIRDDDTSYFTQPEDLEAVYGPYWGQVPISLAVVPFSVPEHRGRSFDSSASPNVLRPVGDNPRLVTWLREKLALGHIEIMLHGFDHRYQWRDGRWHGEYAWKPQAQLMEETRRGKAYLEELLGVRIRVFVPPSNAIGIAGIRAIRAAGLHLSGIMGRSGDRPFSIAYAWAYLRRWGWRCLHGDVYPYPLRYDGHTELRAYAMTPRADPAALLRSLEACTRWEAPFVVATHYWEFRECPSMHRTLKQLISAARSYGMSCVPVSSCYGE